MKNKKTKNRLIIVGAGKNGYAIMYIAKIINDYTKSEYYNKANEFILNIK